MHHVVHQPITEPGDVILFSEATVHGCLPWVAEHQRRVALYRFAPATVAYGRAYFPSWPAQVLDRCTEMERSVLEPPYASRVDRPHLADNGASVQIQQRSPAKKDFDRTVHGTDYF